jgi:Na+-transporting NADH:ubiquinone oxidoreductase subunit NqrA
MIGLTDTESKNDGEPINLSISRFYKNRAGRKLDNSEILALQRLRVFEDYTCAVAKDKANAIFNNLMGNQFFSVDKNLDIALASRDRGKLMGLQRLANMSNVFSVELEKIIHKYSREQVEDIRSQDNIDCYISSMRRLIEGGLL